MAHCFSSPAQTDFKTSLLQIVTLGTPSLPQYKTIVVFSFATNIIVLAVEKLQAETLRNTTWGSESKQHQMPEIFLTSKLEGQNFLFMKKIKCLAQGTV